MAITEVSLHRKGDIDHQYEGVSLEDTWRVHANAGETRFQILTAPGLPVYFEQHPEYLNARVNRRRAQLFEGSNGIWECRINYDTRLPDPNQDPIQIPDPVLRPPVIRLSSRDVVYAFDRDLDGNDLVTPAGEAYDPPVEITIKNTVYVLTRYEYDFSEAIREQYIGKVNASAIGTKEPGSVLINDITATSVYENGLFLWRVSYELEWKRPFNDHTTWDEKIPSIGYYARDAFGKMSPVWYKPGDNNQEGEFQALNDFTEDERENAGLVPAPNPVRIDASGVVINDPTEETHFKTYRKHDEIEFAPLGLLL